MMKTVFIILAAFLAGLFLAGKLGCNPPSPVQQTGDVIDTTTWITDGGDIVSSLKGSPEAFAVPDKHYADSLAKVYKTKAKKLQEYITFLESSMSNVPAVPGIDIGYAHDGDSVGPQYFPLPQSHQIISMHQVFKSPYYTADVMIGDSSYLHLQSYDTVTVLWKRVKQSGKRFLQLDVSTANPDTRVSGIKTYRVYEKPKKWGIGLVAGYGISIPNGTTYGKPNPVPFIGIGLTRTLIRF